MTERRLRVLFLAAEAAPFMKIGGLGDVAGVLPAALSKLKLAPAATGETDRTPPDFDSIDIRLVLPFHGAIQRQAHPWRTAATFMTPTPQGPVRTEALEVELDGLTVYFISGPLIPPDAPVYTADPAADGAKFAFFSLASLELARTLDWVPHVVHANDWHTAPAIYSLGLGRKPGSFYYNTATVLGLHNLPYLGTGAGPALAEFGLPPATGSDLPEWAQHLPLPLGLLTADHIVAPSPGYAHEILTPEFGSGLHTFLRQRSKHVSGILNGLDTKTWDPRLDAYIPLNYGLESLEPRQRNKAALQHEFNLPIDPDRPLLAVVSRLDPQKGIDLIPEAMRLLQAIDWQLILLGTGMASIEEAMQALEQEFPDRVRVALRFDSALSHRIYAGSDALLIPSRYEPCGLTQMIAMRYGCVPVARATGGLKDTILDYSRSTLSTGFLFDQPDAAELASAIQRMLQVFPNRPAWQDLQTRGMRQDFTWERSAAQYADLYMRLSRGNS